jgi:acyl-CoA thioesterase I
MRALRLPFAPRAAPAGAPTPRYGNRPGPVQTAAIARRFTIACTIACAAVMAWGSHARGAAADPPLRMVALGDSLTAGFGLPAQAAFPAQLARALNAKGTPVAIANAGVSGDTAADGLARLAWSVPEGTEAVIIELGANDALRGIDPQVTRTALEAILRGLKQRRIAVLLTGMLAPRNLGGDYTRAFDAIFAGLAAQFGTLFYPFFLDGVATNPALNQADGLHPTAAGVDLIVRKIMPKVEELIESARSNRQN